MLCLNSLPDQRQKQRQAMFTSKKKLQLIDYQNSYHYKQQRKKRRYKCLKLSFLVLLITSVFLALVTLAPVAQSNPLSFDQQSLHNTTFIHGPQLIFSNSNVPNGSAIPASFPIDVEANIEINGLVAYAEIKQTFINPYAIALEGNYQFPLPENSAVKQLIIKVGDKEIIGEIMEKKAAKKMYQQAKKQGKKASLVSQHRPNLFTNKIANIPAQSTVVVTLKFIMPIVFSNGQFNFQLPLAITPRYQPKSTSHLTMVRDKPLNKNIDEESNDHYRSVAQSLLSITVKLHSGIPIANIFSDSHNVQLHALNNQQNAYQITLDNSQVLSDKYFDLRWQLLTENQAQISTFTQEVAGEHYTLLTFFPPKTSAAQVIPRDLIFIIDTSGSMQGNSMKQAKESLHLALLQLNNKDSFNIIAFDNTTDILFPMTQMASSTNIKTAQQFINELTADGGTEMYRPLSNALIMKKNDMQTDKAIRQIVFITDGAVANEFELMQLLNTAQGNFRLYTIGIGAAPNGYFMKKAAQFGRGSYVFIQNNHNLQQKMTDFMTKISQPAISDIKLMLDNQVHQQVEVYPKKLPDLYFGETLQIAIKSQLPIMHIQLSGERISEPWYQQLIIDENGSSKGISTLWARRKIESLLDSLIAGANKEQVKSQVISTSLTHQIISPYTSFIAVEKTIKKPPENPYLLNKNKQLASKNLSMKKLIAQKNTSKIIDAHKSLLVAMPQTSIGWQLQFIIGMILILLGLLFMKITDVITLANKQLIRVNGNAKHN